MIDAVSPPGFDWTVKDVVAAHVDYAYAAIGVNDQHDPGAMCLAILYLRKHNDDYQMLARVAILQHLLDHCKEPSLAGEVRKLAVDEARDLTIRLRLESRSIQEQYSLFGPYPAFRP